MAKRGVLAEDAAELRDASPALRVPVAVPQQLPYDEAVTLGTPISASAFQRAVAAVRRAGHIGAEVQVCHACVRAAAAAAKAKAAAAAAASKAKAAAAAAKAKAAAAAAKAKAAADAKNRLEKAAEEKLRTLQRKQRVDAAAAAAELARQRSLIARLQVARPQPSHTHLHPRFSSHAARAGRRQLPPLRAAARESQPLARVASTLAKLLTCVCAFQMQDALRQARAQAQLQQLRDAAAVARASRQLKTGQRFEQRRLRGASAVE
jgi:pyruvate/2-oxoglutarate dehydrogenase complex dihydrolipoamide acyltransferase (E2) component